MWEWENKDSIDNDEIKENDLHPLDNVNKVSNGRQKLNKIQDGPSRQIARSYQAKSDNDVSNFHYPEFY